MGYGHKCFQKFRLSKSKQFARKVLDAFFWLTRKAVDPTGSMAEPLSLLHRAAVAPLQRDAPLPSNRHGADAELSAPGSHPGIDPVILALDFSHVGMVLGSQEHEPWDLEMIDAVEIEYKAFWTLIRQNPDLPHAPPNRRVDAFAHAHITACTRRYEADCAAAFDGGFLHHYGLAGMFDDADAEQQRKRIELSRRRFDAAFPRSSSTGDHLNHP